jgi:hypothetical protein
LQEDFLNHIDAIPVSVGTYAQNRMVCTFVVAMSRSTMPIDPHVALAISAAADAGEQVNGGIQLVTTFTRPRLTGRLNKEP